MPDYTVGTASLQIIPNFSGANDKINAQAKSWGDSAGKTFSTTFNDAVKAGTGNAPLGPSDEDSTEQGSSSGGKFADAFEARLEAAFRSLPKADIDADSSDADRKVAEVRAELETLSNQTVGVDISDDEALAKLAELKAALVAIGSDSESIQLKVDTASALAQIAAVEELAKTDGDAAGGAFADGFKEHTTAALAALPETKITADSSDAERKIAEIRAELLTLTNQRIGIDISDTDALAKVAALQAALRTVGGGSTSPEIKVNAAEAVSELGELQSTAQGAQAGLTGLGTDAAESGPELSGILVPAIGAVVAALVPVGGLALGAFAALPGIVAGAASGLGAMKLGLGGVEGALSAYSAQQKTAGKNASDAATSATDAANTALSNAQSQRNAASSVAAATEALANAKTSAARSEVQATQELAEARANAASSIASATAALAQAQQDDANAVHAAEEQLTASERSLAQAQYTEQQAQLALTEARKEATEQLISLNDQVADGNLAIQTAQLALTAALKQLNKAKVTPTVTATQLAQDTLTYQQAKQHLQDLQDQQAQLVTQQQAAQAAGVTGANTVVQAQNALTQAIQAVTTAQQSVADNTVALTQARVTGLAKVQAAETALAQATLGGFLSVVAAQTAATLAQVQGAQSVTDAQTALNNALADQATTLQQIALGTGGSGGTTTTTNAFATAMAKLTPEGQKFVNFVISTLLPRYTQLKSATQESLLPGIQSGLTAMIPLFTSLGFFVVEAGFGIGVVVTKIGQFLGSKQGTADMVSIFQSGATFMWDLGTALTTLVPAFATLGSQASPIVDHIGSGVKSIAHDFANWVSNGGFEKFVTWLRQNGPDLVNDLETGAKAVGHFATDLAPIGKDIDDMLGSLGKVYNVLSPVIGLFFQWGPIGQLIKYNQLAIRGIADGVDYLSTHWRQGWNDIHTAVNTTWHAIDNDVFHPIEDFFTTTIPHAFDVTITFLKGVPGKIGSAVGDLGSDIWGSIVKATSWLDDHVWSPVQGWFNALPGKVETGVGDLGSDIWSLIVKATSWLDDHVWSPVQGWFNALPGKVETGVGDLGSDIWSLITKATSWLDTHVWLPVQGWFNGIPGKVKTGVGDLGSDLWGLLNVGTTWLTANVWGPVTGWFTTTLPKALKGAVGKLKTVLEYPFLAAWDGIADAWNTTVGKLHFTTPNWLSIVGLGTKTFGMPTITTVGLPALAAGTGTGTVSGLALVGERGPEIANFGAPVQVIPNHQLVLDGGSTRPGPLQHVEHMHIHEPSDAVAMSQNLAFMRRAGRL